MVFGVAGLQDTVIASNVLEQSFAVGATHSSRLFSTDAGIRLAEAASLTTVAIHVLLTEVLYALAVELRMRRNKTTLDNCVLISSDLEDLRILQDECINNNVKMICESKEDSALHGSLKEPHVGKTVDVESPNATPPTADTKIPAVHPHDEATIHGRRWGNHVLEPFVTFLLSVAYVLCTVTAGTPALQAIIDAAYTHDAPANVRYGVAFLDAFLAESRSKPIE